MTTPKYTPLEIELIEALMEETELTYPETLAFRLLNRLGFIRSLSGDPEMSWDVLCVFDFDKLDQLKREAGL